MNTIFKNIPEKPVDCARVRFTLNDSEWFVICAEQKGDDYYCYGFVNFTHPEYGYFYLSELLENGAELDTEWVPRPMSIVAAEIVEDFINEVEA